MQPLNVICIHSTRKPISLPFCPPPSFSLFICIPDSFSSSANRWFEKRCCFPFFFFLYFHLKSVCVHIFSRHEVPVTSQPITIVYMDDDIVVVNKPASIPVSGLSDCHYFFIYTVNFFLKKFLSFFFVRYQVDSKFSYYFVYLVSARSALCLV